MNEMMQMEAIMKDVMSISDMLSECHEVRFIMTMCMAVEMWCFYHGCDPKETLEMMAKTTASVQEECGMLNKGEVEFYGKLVSA